MAASLAVVIGVYITGAIGYYIIEGCSLFDAFYLCTITLSTVGYGETIELDRAGRIWTIVIITFGLVVVSFAFTSLVSLSVSGDIREMMGRKKMQAKIRNLKNHVIFCGYGRMGLLTVEHLRRQAVECVVIERDAEVCPKLADLDIPFVQGDATEEEVLISAGLINCRALVAALPGDAENVYVTLTARGLKPDLFIIARAEQSTAEPKLRRAGATRVICPQIVGATKVSNILTRPHVTDFFEMAAEGIELELDEFIIEEHSSLCDRSLRDAPIREVAGATVVAIKLADGETIYQPSPDQKLSAGDVLIMIGRAGVSNRLRDLQA